MRKAVWKLVTMSSLVQFLNRKPSDFPNADPQTWEQWERLKHELWQDLKWLRRAATKDHAVKNIVQKKSEAPSPFPALSDQGETIGYLYLNKEPEGLLEVLGVKIKIPDAPRRLSALEQFKVRLYQVVWKSFLYRDGRIQQIRQCGQCGRFFIATARNKIYCSKKCARTADKKDAVFRMRKLRGG